MPASRWERGIARATHDAIASEAAVALVYNGTPHVVMMATPSDVMDFATGFTLSERIVGCASEIRSVRLHLHADGVEADIRIADTRFRALDRRQRNLVGRTGCGLCGARSLAQAIRPSPPVRDTFRIVPQALQRALTAIGPMQALNATTGCMHAAAWFGRDGAIALVREDVGRHNALDKLVGALAARDADFSQGAALVTSRASYEMVQKAAAVGIEMLCAVSAPTTLAVRTAQDAGVTLVAFAREGRHSAYAHPHRVAALLESAAA